MQSVSATIVLKPCLDCVTALSGCEEYCSVGSAAYTMQSDAPVTSLTLSLTFIQSTGEVSVLNMTGILSTVCNLHCSLLERLLTVSTRLMSTITADSHHSIRPQLPHPQTAPASSLLVHRIAEPAPERRQTWGQLAGHS